MLLKVLNILRKISELKLFGLMRNRTLGDITQIFGVRLEGGLGKLTLGSFNTTEIDALQVAIEARDIESLGRSELLLRIYELITFEDIRAFLGQSDLLPELSGPVNGSMTFAELLDLVDSFADLGFNFSRN